MATKLQSALANVQAPKVSLAEIRGKSYQAQAQNAVRVEQTNLGQQIPAMIQAGGQLYGQYVDESWKQAKNLYDEAKLNDKDPLQLAGERARQESDSLIGRTKEVVQNGLGIDPIAYTRAYTAQKYAENQSFQTDAMIQEKIKAGDFATVDDMKKTRQTLRKDIAGDVAKATGLKSTNAFILQGATANEQRSEEALVVQQTAAEDANLRNTRKQLFLENFNLALKSGVQDAAVFVEMANNGLKDGTFNHQEHYQMMGQIAQSLADTGNTQLLNSFFNQKYTLQNGEVKNFGDIIPVEIRDGLFLTADEQWLNNNKETYDKYSRMGAEAAIAMENGENGKAMALVEQRDALLNKHQGSGRVTAQMKENMNLRNQILIGINRQNNIKRAANDKLAKNIAEQGKYKEAVTTALAGGLATTDWNALGITDDNAREATRSMITEINGNADLTPEQKQAQIAQLASVLPDRSELRKAHSEYQMRGLDNLSMVLAQAANSKAGEIPQMPVEFEGLMKQYKHDPALFQKVSDPKVYEEVAKHANSIDRLGWDTYAKSISQPLAMDTDTKDNFTAYMDEGSKGRMLTAPQQANVMTRAQEYARIDPNYASNPQKVISNAVDRAFKEFDSQNVTLGDNGADVLPRSVLIAGGNPETVPVVQAKLTSTVTELRKNASDDILFVQHDSQGRISVISSWSGKAMLTTSAEELYRKAGDDVNAQKEAERIRKVAAVKKQSEAAKRNNKESSLLNISLSGRPVMK
ncbi:MAG: hypothetical protein ACRDCE_20360 [Cetobacterium sp.]|uniref:hypothetical protein n=1 Tax=Cetobacterium sp. TaxID=2071632 RepID=UPI003EE64305